MKFFATIKDSIFNPSFYKSLMVTPAGESMKFFFKFIAILALLQVILVIPVLVGLIKPENFAKLTALYPRELEIKVENGIATTSVPQPYFIKNPFSSQPENIAAIDTESAFSRDQFDTYKTVFILKKDQIAVLGDKNGEVRLMPLSSIGTATLNYNLVESGVTKLRTIAKFVLPLLILFMIAGVYIAFIFKLLYLFIAALLIWLIATILKKQMTYMKAYQFGVHALVFPFILQVLGSLAGLHFPPFLFTILLCFIAGFNMKELPNKVEPTQTPTVL